MSIFYRFSYKVLMILSLFFSVAIFLCSFVLTSYSYNMDTQVVLIKFDNMIVSGTILAVIVLLVNVIAFISSTQHKKLPVKLTEVIMQVEYFVFGVLLIAFGRTNPAADAMSVYAGGASIASGDFSAFSGFDSYFSFYPFQVGLSFVEAPFIKIWNVIPVINRYPAYHGLKIIYVVLIMITAHLLIRIADIMFESELTSFVLILLLFFNIPLIMYSSFVYGEVPGLCAFLGGLFFTLSFMKDEKNNVWKVIIAVGLFAMSVIVRKNSFILIIAVFIAVLYEAIRLKKKSVFFLAAAIVIVPLVFSKLPTKYVEYKIGERMPEGVTALSYIAMGMQEAERGAGWYNGYNFITYKEAGLNAEIANDVSKKVIKERLNKFVFDPSYAMDFYFRKFSSLWCDGTYACRQATLSDGGGRTKFMWDLYNGQYQYIIVNICNIWQNFLYLGFLLFVIRRIWGKESDFKYGNIITSVFIIAAFGGLLFHFIWEANSRYIFTYAMLLLPVAAAGFDFERIKPNEQEQS